MNLKLPSRNLPQHEISARARQLWRLAGEPRNRDREFWLAAETRIDRERAELFRALSETHDLDAA